jgi:membrane dipeptidase
MALTAIAAALALASAGQASDDNRDISEAEAREVHDRVLTLDTHVDIGRGYATPELDPGGLTHAQVDLPKMRIGGLDAAFFIVYVGQGDLDDEGYARASARAEDSYQAIMRMVRGYPERIGLAVTADEAEALHEEGRLVALIGMENAWPLGESVDDIPMWAERGVRYVGITHFRNNQFGGSSNPDLSAGDPMQDPGLTDLGRELVAALNDHGIMVDISHVGPRTSMEAIELSRAPVIASHSGVRGVYDHPRNLSDEQLDALRDNGGVAQMVAFRGYVAEVDPRIGRDQNALRGRLGMDTAEGRQAASAEDWAEYNAEMADIRARYPDVTLAQFVDHIDYAVERIGVDHVGIVSDFDGGGGVEGWDDASETLNVTWELMRRGYSEEDIGKIWSGNVLRVMRGVEDAAAR